MALSSLAHGVTYKITSVKDGTVLDVTNSEFKSGTPVLAFPWHGGDNQRWKADMEGSGFRLMCAGGKTLPSGIVVLDENVSASSVTIYQFHGGTNQQWVAQPVPNMHQTYFIVSAQTKRVLTHSGQGNRVKTSPISGCGNSSQWWTFMRVWICEYNAMQGIALIIINWIDGFKCRPTNKIWLLSLSSSWCLLYFLNQAFL